MKKIIIAMAAIAAAFTMASCNKEQPVSPNENPTVGKSVITASIENDLTKAYLDANGNDKDGYKVFWSNGDDLFVGGVDEEGDYNSWIARYTLEESSAGSSQGTFSWQTGQFFYNIIAESSEGVPEFVAGNMYMALHPFDLINTDTDTYIWRTEQTYSESAGYIPMVGAAECTEDGKADFVFTNLGGLLRLTVKGAATIKSITVQAGEPMSGEIAAIIDDDEGNMVALMLDETEEGAFDTNKYVTLDCGDGVDLSSEGIDFHISMPCHYTIEGTNMILDGYTYVTITLTDTEDRTCVKKLHNKNGLVIERGKITTATFTASEFKTNVPEGALPGKFSVSADKQVYFSQGNLYADGDNALHFEANQYSFASSWDASHVSHFTWSSTVADAVSDSNNGDNLFCDESHKVSVDGGEAIFYALSKDEWTYLFNNHRKKWVSVNGVNGYVIAPDAFNGELADTYADDAALAANNLVFLPAAGIRQSSNVRSVGDGGVYWSSSADDEGNTYYVGFDGVNVYPDNNDNRYYGCSVRLITESN